MQHSFDIEIAKQFGVLEAILLNNFEFWIAKNAANETNFHEGSYWTFNSVRALNDLFPYCSQRQIQNALAHLRDEGILKTGNFNETSYDRTLWYAFTEKGKSIMQNCKMDSTETGNGNGKNVEPIPYENTDQNTDRKHRFSAPSVAEVAAYCSERNNDVDAQRFVDYYQANGWKVGRNPMKDWKAAVRTWERNGRIRTAARRDASLDSIL